MNIVKQKICRWPAPSLSRRTVALPRMSGSIVRSSWREAASITLGWTGTRNFLYKRPLLGAQVAQLVEQRTENPCVGGSIPPLGTIAASGHPSCLVLAGLGASIVPTAATGTGSTISIAPRGIRRDQSCHSYTGRGNRCGEQENREKRPCAIEKTTMIKTRGTGLLMVWSDIDAEFEAEFNRWYDEEHVPRLLQV